MADPMIAGLLAMFGAFIAVFFVIGIAIYVYSALALMSIAKRLNDPHPWLAWIPYANFALVLSLGGFHWAWVFLLIGAFIPFVGILVSIAVAVLAIISMWRICEKRNFPGWTVLLTLIPGLGGIWGLVLIGILAWKKD